MKWLFSLCVLLKLADVGTTYYALTRNLGTEFNPLVAWGIGLIGLVPALTIVFCFFVVVVSLLFEVGKLWPFIVTAVMMSIVVGNNLIVLCGGY